MVRYHSHNQLFLAEFDGPFPTVLDANSRLVKLTKCIPCDESAKGGSAIRRVIRIRCPVDDRCHDHHYQLCPSYRKTIADIQENPSMQFLIGLTGFPQMKNRFAPSLPLEIPKRMEESVFEVFQGAIIDALQDTKEKQKTTTRPDDDNPTSTGRGASEQKAPEPLGKLILDATVAQKTIRYPTDLILLNEARKIMEQIIDTLYPKTVRQNKPRSYRIKARECLLGDRKAKTIFGRDAASRNQATAAT